MVYGWNIPTGGTHFHRVQEPLRVLRESGTTHTAFGVRLDDSLLEQHDTVLTYMLTQERASAGWRKLAKLGTHRMIIDIDDAMWVPDYLPFKRYYTPEVITRLYRNIECAHVVTTPSEVIAEFIRDIMQLNQNVHVVPNTIPEYARHARQGRKEHVLAFAGSASHDGDITDAYVSAILSFLTHFTHWKFWLWGKTNAEISGWPKRQTKAIPWCSNQNVYYPSLSRAMMYLVPLRNTAFNRAKSALRLIENAALGITSIVPDLPPYQGWANSGNSLIISGDNDEDEYFDALATLAEDPGLRFELARQAWVDSANYTTEANAQRWVNAWNSI